MAQQLTDVPGIRGDAGSIPGLLSGLRIWHCSCGVGRRLQLRLDPLYAASAALKRPKKKKKKNERSSRIVEKVE